MQWTNPAADLQRRLRKLADERAKEYHDKPLRSAVEAELKKQLNDMREKANGIR